MRGGREEKESPEEMLLELVFKGEMWLSSTQQNKFHDR